MEEINTGFHNVKAVIEIKDNIVKYEVLWYRNIYLSLDFYNLIKNDHHKLLIGEFWDRTKHLISQNELYYYFNTRDITYEKIVEILDKYVIIDMCHEEIVDIFTSSTDYLSKYNIIYHKQFHSITYFWLIVLSGSKYLYECRLRQHTSEKDSYLYYSNKFDKLNNNYKTILNTIYDFGKLKINDDIDNINTYPKYPSKEIIDKIKCSIK